MKKYFIFILVSVFGLVGFSFAQSWGGGCTTNSECGAGSTCNIPPFSTQGTCSNNAGATCSSNSDCLGGLVCNTQVPSLQGTCGTPAPAGGNQGGPTGNNQGGANCDTGKQYTVGGVIKCCAGTVKGGICNVNNEGNMGIDINQQCLVNGQCKFDIYSTLGIRQSLPRETRSSPGIFVQDIILSATFFVGTLITGVLIISGLLFVFAAAKPDLQSRAKKGVMGSLIGLLFVVGSYAFVRLIQFLITGGGG